MKVLRPLDPAERYYWLLDRLAPLGVAATARLTRAIEVDALRSATAAVKLGHPLVGARIDIVDGAPVFVETDDPLPITASTAGTDAELDEPFEETGPLARLRVVEGVDGAPLVRLVVHHAVTDARGAVGALRQILRVVDGRVPPAPTVGAPTPLHDRFPADVTGPRVLRDVVRQVRVEREDKPDPATFPVHRRDAGSRRTRVDQLVLRTDETARLRERARAAGATVHGVLSAALVGASTFLLPTDEPGPVMLLTPTDLRARVAPPIDEEAVQLAIGVLVSPYEPGPGLARRISEQVRRELDRGESHLFYRIVRATSYAADDAGTAAFAEWMRAVPQNVAMSNLGTVAHERDPDWVESVWFSLAASPNQVAFAAATTYRGGLVVDVATDATRLGEDARDRLIAGFSDRMRSAEI